MMVSVDWNATDVASRLKDSVEKAVEAAFAAIAACWPETQTGDLDPLADYEFRAATETAARRWIAANVFDALKQLSRPVRQCAAQGSIETEH